MTTITEEQLLQVNMVMSNDLEFLMFEELLDVLTNEIWLSKETALRVISYTGRFLDPLYELTTKDLE